jgi:hypothetical protein
MYCSTEDMIGDFSTKTKAGKAVPNLKKDFSKIR